MPCLFFTTQPWQQNLQSNSGEAAPSHQTLDTLRNVDHKVSSQCLQIVIWWFRMACGWQGEPSPCQKYTKTTAQTCQHTQNQIKNHANTIPKPCQDHTQTVPKSYRHHAKTIPPPWQPHIRNTNTTPKPCQRYTTTIPRRYLHHTKTMLK